ncbi:hypothetical protein [Catenuloplanes indicus]|uniref:Uncharacterized protein n=1 Tax=Catenuloplanes indicus TaxID=137267 RepID=A0AAE4B0V7_9ACTN|nr:hypothetical protein [Catenuloplanes indicus]MDQ0369947.1 hypothetical protein [Catenuloplanes indicus]
MSGTGTLDAFAALCPDGRLIPIDNGVYFHPYPMGTPVDLIELQRAMNVGTRAGGPAFFMDPRGLSDVAALETVQRVTRDLLGELGAGARITTVATGGAERTWLTAADLVGVPITVLDAPDAQPSARLVRDGDQLHVLPKGLAAMRAVLATAAELAVDRRTPLWTRLERLVARVAEAREEYRVPRSGSVSGAAVWQAGYQLAAGLVLGAPPGTNLTALPAAVQPVSEAELLRLFGGEPRTPESLTGTTLDAPALVHVPGTNGGPGTVRWLVPRDGALWWVDLSADPADAVRRFDPADAANPPAGTTVRVLRPEPARSVLDTPTSLVDALIDAPLGRAAAGALQPTRPAPRTAPAAGVTPGAEGPEELVRAQVEAVGEALREGTPEQQFTALDDLLTRRLPPIRDRYETTRAEHDATVRAAGTAIAAHDARSAELDTRIPAEEARVTAADTAFTAAQDARAAAERARAALTAQIEAAQVARGRAFEALSQSTRDDHVRLQAASVAASQRVNQLVRQAEADDAEIVRLREAEEAAWVHVTDLRGGVAALRAEHGRIPGLRAEEVRRRTEATALRDTAVANRDLLDTHLTHLRDTAADWARLELGDARRLDTRMQAAEADGSALRRAHRDAAAGVGTIAARGGTITVADVGRLAYLRHMSLAGGAVRREQAEAAPELERAYVEYVGMLTAYAGTPAVDGEAARLAGRQSTLALWNALADRFDVEQAAAEAARTEAMDLARNEEAAARRSGRPADLAGVATRLLDPDGRLRGEPWHGASDLAGRLRWMLAETAADMATLRARIEAATAPSAPWFLRERHVLGDSYVRDVQPLDAADVQALTSAIAPAVGDSMRPWRADSGDLAPWLTSTLGSREAADWERLIDTGVAEEFNGKYVRVFVRPSNPRFRRARPVRPGRTGQDVQLQLRFGEKTFSQSRGGSRAWNLPVGLITVLAVTNDLLQAVVGPTLRLFTGGSRRWAEVAGGRINSENFAFTGDWAMNEYDTDAQVVVEVDGREVAAHDLDDHLLILSPQLVSTDRDAVDPMTIGEPTRVTNPGALHHQDYVFTAADFTDPLAELGRRLRTDPAFTLSDTQAARVVDKLRQQFLNPRVVKEQNQWWTTDAGVSPHVSLGLGKGRHLDGHVRTGGKLIDLRRIERTPDAMIRNDAGAATSRSAGRGGSSAVGGRLGVEFPLSVGDHLILPRLDVLTLKLNRDVDRSANIESSAQYLLVRGDKLIRYAATFATELTLDSNRGQLTVRHPTVVELAVPERHAAAFEEQLLSTPELRDAVVLPEGTLTLAAKGAKPVKPFPRAGVTAPADLQKIAATHRIEIMLPEGRSADGPWAWAANHANVDISHPGDSYASVADVPVIRYQTDPADGDRILGATVFTRSADPTHPDPVTAEYVPNPAHPAAGPAARAAAAPDPWGAHGVRDAVDLFALARKAPIELAVQGRGTAPAAFTELPPALHSLSVLTGRVRLRGDGAYPAAAEGQPAAAFRYLVDDRGLVLGAIPLRASGGPGALVPNPALYLPAQQHTSVPVDDALESVQRFLDGLDVPGYAQVQLADGVPAAIVAALSADPRVEVVDHTGTRLAGQTLPDAVREGVEPAGVRRHVVSADGWVNGGLRPLTGPTREPWAMAARTGLGPGVMKEMPGAEMIFGDALRLLQFQMAKVGKTLKRGQRTKRFAELAAKLGVPGLRGFQRSLFDGGITDTYTIGDLTFRVNLTGELGDLREVRTVPDYLLDTKRTGRSGLSVRELLAYQVGARVDGSGRVSIKDFFGLRVRLVDLQAAFDREYANLIGLAQAGARRRKVRGTLTEFDYDVRYQLTVSVTDKKGKVLTDVSTRTYGGEAFHAPVRVAEEDLAPAPGTAHSQEPLPGDRPTVTRLTRDESRAARSWLDGAEPDGFVSTVDGNTEGMYVWLNQVGTLAESVQAFVNGVDDARQDTSATTAMLRDLAPGGGRLALEAGVADGIRPDFLEPRASDLMTRLGIVVPLRRSRGGTVRQLRIRLLPANPRFTRPTDGATNRDYQDSNVQSGGSEGDAISGAATVGAGGIFQWGPGAAAVPDDGDGAKGTGYVPGQDPEPGQRIPASSRGADHVNLGVDASVSGRWGVTTSALAGGTTTTRAGYEGRSYNHSADAVYLITYERYSRGGKLTRYEHDLRIAHGMDMSTPHVTAQELGLPIPDADARQMPAKTAPLTPIHKELAFAASPVEKLTATRTKNGVTQDVLAVVKERLRGMDVAIDDPSLSLAVENLFRTSAIKAHYRTIRRDGLEALITLNRPLGGVKRIGIRLTADDGPLTYRRPRPDVKGTISKGGLDQRGWSEAKDRSAKIGPAGDARFGPGDARMAIGAGAEAEWGRTTVDGRTDSDQPYLRVSPTNPDSQEFGTHTVLKLEFFEASDLPQALEAFVSAGSATAKMVDTISDGWLRTLLQEAVTGKRKPKHTETVPGRLRLITPSHLTQERPPFEAVPHLRSELPKTAADIKPASVRVLNRNPPPGGPADLQADLAVTARLAGHVQALEIFGFDAFTTWLPTTRMPGAERYDTTKPVPRLPGYAPWSTALTSVKAALSSTNVTPNISRLLTGGYTVKGDGADEFTVRAVLRGGTWLSRGDYRATNMPIKVTALSQRRDQRSGLSIRPVEVEAGPREGDEKLIVATGIAGGGSHSAGDASGVGNVEITYEKKAGDYDYFWFDLTLIGTSSNGRAWVRSDVPHGLIARIPSEKAAEVFGPRATLGIIDQALVQALADDAPPAFVADRRFMIERLAGRGPAAPNLLRQEELDAAVQRLRDWLAATEVPAPVPGAPRPAVTPEDCVIRAFGAFIAVHRRTANGTTDTDRAGDGGAEDLATSLRGDFARLRDPDSLWRYAASRPGTMIAFRVPPPPAGNSHLFWVMSIGGGRMMWVDGQRHGAGNLAASIGTPLDNLRGLITDQHARMFRKSGTEVLMLDERGRSIDLRAALPDVLTNRASGDRLGRRASGELPQQHVAPSLDLAASTLPGIKAPLSDVKAQLSGVKAPLSGVKAQLSGVKAPLSGVKAQLSGVKAPVPAGTPPLPQIQNTPPAIVAPDREIMTLGDFTTQRAGQALERITASARGVAGPPVRVINLGGPAESALAAVRRLDETLRNDAWRGVAPIVVATMGTKRTEDAFALVRHARGAVTVQETMDADFKQVWQLLGPHAAQADTMVAAPTVELFRRAGTLVRPAGGTLTPELAAWISAPDWAATEAYHRAYAPALHTPGVADELRRVIAENPADQRLPGLLLALETGRRAGGVPDTRLTPRAVSFLEAEPAYRGGPVPPTFVYDYLAGAGRGRRDRFTMDGLLFQLMLAGQLSPDETLALARTGTANRLDRANVTVIEMVADLLAVSPDRLRTDSAAVTAEFVARARRVASTQTGVKPEECLDPVDRTAWVGRLDGLRDDLRARGETARAAILDALTYTLSNC